MPQIPVPKLPCTKLGIVNSKSGTYYYVQTYTHHYDKVKKRSVSAYNVKKDLPFHKNGIMHLFEGSCRFHQKDQICDAA